MICHSCGNPLGEGALWPESSRMPNSPRRRRSELAETLRRRVVGAVTAGSLRRGDRLPSAREVAAEFGADPRLVLAAYRILAIEGVVEIRRRSGIYVATTPEVAGGPAVVAEGWLADVLAEGVEHGISAPRLGEWLKRCVTTRRLRAAVVADTADQLEAFCAELREDYGVDAVPFAPDAIGRPGGLPPEMLGADFVVAEDAHAEALRRALAPGKKRVVAVRVRTQMAAEWRHVLARGDVTVVVTDPRTEAVVRDAVPGAASRVHVLVLGRDDVRAIAPGTPVYVTRSARRRLGTAPIPGRMMPPERAFSSNSAREILTVVVDANLAAMRSG